MKIKYLSFSLAAAVMIFSYDSFSFDCKYLPSYSQAIGYDTGDRVKNANYGFQCLVGGWCAQGDPFAPGTGWASSSAWENLGKCEDDTGEPTNNKPRISLHGPYSSVEGQTIQFDGESISRDSDGFIASFRWSFGDGFKSNDANPSHSYSTQGIYDLEFEVIDDDGASDNSATTVTVSIQPNQKCPAPRYIRSERITKGAVRQNAGLDFRCTGVPCEKTEPGVSQSWERYWSPLGSCDSNTDYNNYPIAQFSAPFGVNVDMEVAMDSHGSSDPDGHIINYDWDFGDGTTSTERNPVHSYREDGKYTVTLIITDNQGGTDEYDRIINVSPSANPDCWAPVFFVGIDAEVGDIVQHQGKDYRCQISTYCSGLFFDFEPGADNSATIWEDLGSCSSEMPVNKNN